ncbi:hypothetical protein F8M41_009894 [Gigaspora margarita]|uniref:Uncharacterized protein n=1 Tax=Gigaspora margarita TaxID=4874 RepID=A0A8H3X2Z6_GIGMA|nr:hypothetical protein F8M41_009894 [Gigaspora margarita]
MVIGANYIVVITFVEYVWILIHETLGICQLMIIMGLYDLKLEVQILNESVESLCKTKITVRSVVWLVGCHNFLVVRSRRCWYHHGDGFADCEFFVVAVYVSIAG